MSLVIADITVTRLHKHSLSSSGRPVRLFALQVYARHSIQDPASEDGAPAREQSGYFGVALCLQGSPLASVRCIPTSEVSITAECVRACM